jgi:hypothetical protein
MLFMGERQEPSPMYFRSIDTCQYYAKRIPKQYGYVGGDIRITAYCKPQLVDPKKTLVYDK